MGNGKVYILSLGLAQFVKKIPTLGTAGATAMILGDNLTGATKVSINGITAAFTVVSSIEIKAVVPTGATTGAVSRVGLVHFPLHGAVFGRVRMRVRSVAIDHGSNSSDNLSRLTPACSVRFLRARPVAVSQFPPA